MIENTNNAILLRKLTKKSVLKFGKYRDYTVGHLIEMKLYIQLTSIYFKLTAITFTDDILDELGITAEYRISKPSKNIDLYNSFLSTKYGKKQKPNKSLQAMKKQTVSYSKQFLMGVNHGR